MAFDDEEDLTTYKVVIKHEEQYSIWPVDRENPLGWADSGPSGKKAECLAYIEEVWMDMRPLSLRKHMEKVARQEAQNPPPPAPPPSTEPPPPDELVTRLATGSHPVEVGLRPERTAQLIKDAIDRGEEYLLELYQRFLKVDRITLDDNFFVLGGDSIGATQIANQIQSQIPALPIDAVTIFEHPTVAELHQFFMKKLDPQSLKEFGRNPTP